MRTARGAKGFLMAFIAILLVFSLLGMASISADQSPSVSINFDKETAKADLSLGINYMVKYGGNISLSGAKTDGIQLTAYVLKTNWDVTISPTNVPITGDTVVAFTGKATVPKDAGEGVYQLRVKVTLNTPPSDPERSFMKSMDIVVVKNRVAVQAPADLEVQQKNVTQTFRLSFTVTNIGSTNDRFSYDITNGIGFRDQGWLVDLLGDKDGAMSPEVPTQVVMNITIPADAPAGTYDFTMVARSEDYPSSASQATAQVQVIGTTPPVATPPKEAWSFLGLGYIAWSMISIAIVGVCMIVVIGGTEVGYFAFLVWIFVPLYCRIMKEKVLDNFTRGEIYGYIKANPGAHYMELQSQLDLPNGVLAHHLMVLEREEFVKVHRDGLYKRFYPRHVKVLRKEKHLSRIQKQLMDEVDRHPGISQTTLAKYLEESKQVISYHIRVLHKAGFVNVQKEGGVSKVSAVKGMWPAKEVEEVSEVEEVVVTEAAPASAGSGDAGVSRIGPGHIGRI